MSKIADQSYLLADQYSDAAKYAVRVDFHRQFSTNRYSWFLWVFDQLHLPSQCRLLEVGCGPGTLWYENRERVPTGWEITLSDFSTGMVEQARANLHGIPCCFEFVMLDSQAIPFDSESFDVVVANHVLYHVPDRSRVFSEIKRVLRSGGRLYASTVGQSHLSELPSMLSRFDSELSLFWGDSLRDTFTLDTGLDELSHWFSSARLAKYDDRLLVTECDPLLSFVLASCREEVGKDKRLKLAQFLQDELDAHQAIHVTRDIGIFEAIR
jgi:ubiquinone/menaquinone biosynthesis C-methylase UbiE